MNEDYELIIGDQRVMRSRLDGYIVSPNSNRMVVKLKNPVDRIKIDKPENVSQALLEIHRDPSEFDRTWRTVGLE